MEQQNENRLGINEKSGLFILIGLMGVGFVVGGFVSITAWKLMTGQDMAQMQVSMSISRQIAELIGRGRMTWPSVSLKSPPISIRQGQLV